MKKKFFATVVLMLAASVYTYCGTGTASISPASLAPLAIHPVITIIYKTAAANGISAGAVAVQVNTGFIPAPSAVTTDAGAVTAVIMQNGTNPIAVPQDNILIDGYAVTINSITMQTVDSLIITYGNTGTAGIYGPINPGVYPFYMSEKTLPADLSFTALDSQPIIYVSNMVLSKSSSTDLIEAGNTVTYTLTYSNMDTGNSMNSVSIMDSMPQGLIYVSAQPSPSNINGSIYTWNVGSVASIGGGGGTSITVTAKAVAGIASYGFTTTNYATIYGSSPANGSNGMAVSRTVNVEGAVLSSSITASPGTVAPGGIIKVVMNVTNSGNLAATGLTPSPLSMLGSGTAVYLNGPAPANISSLAANSSGSFTWTYTANYVGAINFSNHYYADDNGQNIPNSNISSNNVTIQYPTPTGTPTLTGTQTPVVPTETSTPQDTDTPTFTVTPAVTSTTVPQNTDSPTVTATSTIVLTTPTPVPTISGKVVMDRNYINIDKGDKVAIVYKVERDGNSWIDVYNLNGELVRNFYKATLTAGDYTAYWDGTNSDGKKVGQGMYFIVVHQPGGTSTRKLIVIK
jgi:uncharacterized repeat protein (TIGR01451 family)